MFRCVVFAGRNGHNRGGGIRPCLTSRSQETCSALGRIAWDCSGNYAVPTSRIIYFNQTSAAGLYGLEDFRLVCDTLDLESSQERAHIAAFKTVSEQVEREVFGERVFTSTMRALH